jgi:hypothetical protein
MERTMRLDSDLGRVLVAEQEDGYLVTRDGLPIFRTRFHDALVAWLQAKHATPKAKTGKRQQTAPKAQAEPYAPTILPTHVLVDMAMPGWDERGWHGGGLVPVRKTQRTAPKKGNTATGRRAHRMPYGPGRTW